MARRSDTGPFAIVPEWVLDAPISDRAVRLYGILSRYADDATGESWPSRRTLWTRIGCSERSLDHARRELVGIGALEVEHRTAAEGDRTSNLWIIKRLPPGVGQKTTPRGARTDAQGGAETAVGTRTNRTRSEYAANERINPATHYPTATQLREERDAIPAVPPPDGFFEPPPHVSTRMP